MRLAAILAAFALAASLAWFAGEQHYDNCVDAAQARNPVGLKGGDVAEEFDRFQGEDVKRRQRAIDGCSRLPW